MSFADCLGLDLELIHHLSEANNIFFDSNDLQQPHRSPSTNAKKIIIPNFTLYPNENYEKLKTHGICLDSIKINDNSSIQGVILSIPKQQSKNNEEIKSRIESDALDWPATTITTKYKKPMGFISNRFFKLLKLKNTKKQCSVYVIWSTDLWKTWHLSPAEVKKNSDVEFFENERIQSYEFVIKSLDKFLEVGQILRILICHKVVGEFVFNNEIVNNEESCFNFKCDLANSNRQ